MFPLELFFFIWLVKGYYSTPKDWGRSLACPALGLTLIPPYLLEASHLGSPWNSAGSLPSAVSGHRCGGEEVEVPQCLGEGLDQACGKD